MLRRPVEIAAELWLIELFTERQQPLLSRHYSYEKDFGELRIGIHLKYVEIGSWFNWLAFRL